jgi:hypothetical protein
MRQIRARPELSVSSSDLTADPLSPIDAATLWPQLPRLDTEVVATRSTESLLLRSGIAATGLANLPRVPRTSVLSVKRGLRHRAVVVTRELAGGSAWEVVSLRLARDIDNDAVKCLLGAAAEEMVRRGGKRLLMRYSESSPHEEAISSAGLRPFVSEQMYAIPTRNVLPGYGPFRTVVRSDRPALFRLYCRAVPESVRRNEALTQQEFRAIYDSHDVAHEFALDLEAGMGLWVGIGDREARMMAAAIPSESLEFGLDLIEAQPSRPATLVVAEYQPEIASRAEARGYALMGTRMVSARRMAILNPLKEVVAAGISETMPVPQ